MRDAKRRTSTANEKDNDYERRNKNLCGRSCSLQLFPHGLGTSARVFGDGINLALVIDGDKAAPITASQYQPLRVQCLGEGFAGIRYSPAILKHPFHVLGVQASPFGLLPFFAAKIERVAVFGVGQSGWHLPFVFQVQLSGEVFEFQLEVRQVNGLHVVGVDARPDHMGMTAAFLLMKNDRSWLSIQTQLVLYLFDGGFKGVDGYPTTNASALRHQQKKRLPRDGERSASELKVFLETISGVSLSTLSHAE